MNKEIKIRKNGKYYQLGYYEQSKWIQLEQLGTPDQILNMVRLYKAMKKETYQLHARTKKLLDLEFNDEDIKT